jgi:hypothetical protein
MHHCRLQRSARHLGVECTGSLPDPRAHARSRHRADCARDTKVAALDGGRCLAASAGVCFPQRLQPRCVQRRLDRLAATQPRCVVQAVMAGSTNSGPEEVKRSAAAAAAAAAAAVLDTGSALHWFQHVYSRLTGKPFCLCDPAVAPSGADPGDSQSCATRSCAACARAVEPAPAASTASTAPAAPAGMIDFIQEAGDTVFVPFGWWHVVLNLDEYNIGVTQNYLSEHGFPSAWHEYARHSPSGAWAWWTQLPAALQARLLAQVSTPSAPAHLDTRALSTRSNRERLGPSMCVSARTGSLCTLGLSASQRAARGPALRF